MFKVKALMAIRRLWLRWEGAALAATSSFAREQFSRLSPPLILLDARMQDHPQNMSCSRPISQTLAKRAMIIWSAAIILNHSTISVQLGLSRLNVSKLRRRFLTKVSQGLGPRDPG